MKCVLVLYMVPEWYSKNIAVYFNLKVSIGARGLF